MRSMTDEGWLRVEGTLIRLILFGTFSRKREKGCARRFI